MDEELLADSGVTKVVRVGQTVQRSAGAWTPAVRALLRHLENVGFDGAPAFSTSTSLRESRT
jgi:hypothetical protein